MSKWRYEVEAAVHPVVHNVSSVQSALVMEVPFKLIVDVLDDGLEAEQDEKWIEASLVTRNNHKNTVVP